LLIEHLGWPSVFLLSVPLALVALAIADLTIRESADPQNRRLDLPGQLAGAAILGGLVFAAIDSHRGASVCLDGREDSPASLVQMRGQPREPLANRFEIDHAEKISQAFSTENRGGRARLNRVGYSGRALGLCHPLRSPPCS
jgi:hypothetical protein